LPAWSDAQQTQLPLTQVPDPIPFVSGGVGDDEFQALRLVRDQYDLQIVLATVKTGAYLADVSVQITDQKGDVILSTISDGPIFLAQLPAGRYKVTLSSAGIVQVKSVQMTGHNRAQLVVYW
jgi:hypothetical protein